MFDIQQTIFDKHGELQEEAVDSYINGLMQEFEESSEAQPLMEGNGGVGWAANMMSFAVDYLGCTPTQMTLTDFNEVIFSLFPRKMSTEPENAEDIITEMKAFWAFVSRQYGLPNAKKILDSLQSHTVVGKLERELANPANWGMAKSFIMRGTEAGYDMTSQEGMNEFMQVYNESLQRDPLPFPESDPGPVPLPSQFGFFDAGGGNTSKEEKKKKRKKRQAERNARKRNRKK